MAFQSLKNLYNKLSGKKKAAIEAIPDTPLPVIESAVPLEPAVTVEAVQAQKVAVQVQTAKDEALQADVDRLIQDLLRTTGGPMGPTGESRSSLLAHVKRTLGAMGLPSWDRHEWDTLRRVGHMAADLLSDPEYLRPWVQYYAVKLGFRSTETLVIITAKHAVMDSFSAIVHDAKE